MLHEIDVHLANYGAISDTCIGLRRFWVYLAWCLSFPWCLCVTTLGSQISQISQISAHSSQIAMRNSQWLLALMRIIKSKMPWRLLQMEMENIKWKWQDEFFFGPLKGIKQVSHAFCSCQSQCSGISQKIIICFHIRVKSLSFRAEVKWNLWNITNLLFLGHGS